VSFAPANGSAGPRHRADFLLAKLVGEFGSESGGAVQIVGAVGIREAARGSATESSFPWGYSDGAGVASCGGSFGDGRFLGNNFCTNSCSDCYTSSNSSFCHFGD